MSGFIQNRRAIENAALNSVPDLLSGDRLVRMTSALSRNASIATAAIERFQQFRILTEELQKARARLEERKVIDKARGILKRQPGMSEDEAYKAMRSLTMSSNKRLFEVAGSLVDPAKLLR